MQTLEMSLADLVGRGIVEYEQGVAVSLYPDEITRAAQLAPERCKLTRRGRASPAPSRSRSSGSPSR